MEIPLHRSDNLYFQDIPNDSWTNLRYDDDDSYEPDEDYEDGADYPDMDPVTFLHDRMQTSENPYDIPTTVCGILMGIVASIGIIGNILTAYIYSRKTMGQASIGILLTGLAITDALMLIVAAPLFASSAIYAFRPGIKLMTSIAYMTVYVYPVASALQTASVWLMVVTTLERYLAVCKPFLAISLCTRNRARRTVFAVLAAGTAYNMCRFWEYTPTALDKDKTVVVALPALLRENQTYIQVYVHWMYFLFIFGIPLVILALVNGMVILTIRRARRDRRQLTRQQRKEHATAGMMILVTCAYMACTSLAFVLNAMELWGASGGQDVELPRMEFGPSTIAAVLSDRNRELRQQDGRLHLLMMNRSGSASISAGPDALHLMLENLESSPLVASSMTQAGMPPPHANNRRTTRRHSHLFYFLIDLNNLLVMTHCSLNCLIFYNFNGRFRAHVRAFLCCDTSQLRQTVISEETGGLNTDINNHNGAYQSCPQEETKPIYTRNRLNPPIAVETHIYYGTSGRTIKFTYSYPIRDRGAMITASESCSNLIRSGSPISRKEALSDASNEATRAKARMAVERVMELRKASGGGGAVLDHHGSRDWLRPEDSSTRTSRTSIGRVDL